VLFAGDAGGFVNAFTAEGIYYGMISGELAGRAIVTERADAAAPGRVYERLWRRELGAELSDAVIVQKYLFAGHERVNRAVRAGRSLPWLQSMIVGFTRGELSYPAMRRKLLMKFPMSIMRLATERLGSFVRA
jgi:flavin-dependent dehydrogenase